MNREEGNYNSVTRTIVFLAHLLLHCYYGAKNRTKK